MVLNDHGKLILLTLVLVGVVVLMALNRIDDVAGAGLIGTIVGYVTGNGRLAIRGEQGSPMLAPKREVTGEIPKTK